MSQQKRNQVRFVQHSINHVLTLLTCNSKPGETPQKERECHDEHIKIELNRCQLVPSTKLRLIIVRAIPGFQQDECHT